LVDIDGDGHRDILSGSYSRMEQDMAGLFQVLYGNRDGTLRKAEVLNGADDQPLIIPANNDDQVAEKICTRPFAVDWDGDGHLDLIVGNFTGTFYWFKGQGMGKFAPKPESLKSGGKPLRIGGAHSDPFVIDWDGDGDLDLLSGSGAGGVEWSENKAGKGKVPALSRFRPLIRPGKESSDGQILREEDLTGPMRSTRIWVDDVNGDGKLDILVGDSVTLISPANGVSAEEYKKKLAQWQEELQTAGAALNKPAADAKATEAARAEVSKIYARRSEFMHEEMTGFVWLYLQK
jgi:hypothetical protein